MCVCTQIYMSVCACKTNEEGVKRLISHYGEQWLNKAVDRREKQLEKRSEYRLLRCSIRCV